MFNIKIGDSVWLKSGGPKMTVKTIDNKLICCWFVRGELKDGHFNFEEITKINPCKKVKRILIRNSFVKRW